MQSGLIYNKMTASKSGCAQETHVSSCSRTVDMLPLTMPVRDAWGLLANLPFLLAMFWLTR